MKSGIEVGQRFASNLLSEVPQYLANCDAGAFGRFILGEQKR